MKNALIAILVVSLLVMGGCSTILGPEGSEPELPDQPAGPPYFMLVEGEPSGSIMTAQGGLFLWKTGNSLHLRILKERGRRIELFPRDVFKGKVEIDRGFVAEIRRQNISVRDILRSHARDLSFEIELTDEVKGFDLRIEPERTAKYCITFSVTLNGKEEPGIIRLGRSAHVPMSLPLTMCFFSR